MKKKRSQRRGNARCRHKIRRSEVDEFCGDISHFSVGTELASEIAIGIGAGHSQAEQRHHQPSRIKEANEEEEEPKKRKGDQRQPEETNFVGTIFPPRCPARTGRLCLFKYPVTFALIINVIPPSKSD